MVASHFMSRMFFAGAILLLSMFAIENTHAVSATTPPLEITAGCLISSSNSAELYNNGSYMLSSLSSSHQTLWWQTKYSCSSTCDSAVSSFPGKRMYCFWNGNSIKEYIGGIDPNPSSVDFVVKNCSIPAGKSTCHTGVYVTWPAGNTYSIENMTRSITSSSIITPNNYSNATGKYFLDPTKTESIGDTANNLKYGTNYLKLKQVIPGSILTTTLTSTTAEATCAIGTTWNGQTCSTRTWPIACTMAARLCEDGDPMPFDSLSCEWLPGQCKPVTPLTITCTKSSYTVWEETSCKIYGWIGEKTCWQRGTKDTSAVDCQTVWWDLDGEILYYYTFVTSSMVGNYTLYVSDSTGRIASKQVSYVSNTPPPNPAPSISATNCTIASGKRTCISTVTMNPSPLVSYSLDNTTRSITMTNAFRTGVSTISTSNLWEQASNYLTHGINSLVAKNGTTLITTQATATCATWTTWNGQTCSTRTSPPIACTMEMRYCEDGSAMPRNLNNCEWLPGQCAPEIPATSIDIRDYVINDTVYDFTWGLITLSESDTLSLIWNSQPNAKIYFSREWQSTYETTKTNANGAWALNNVWSPGSIKVVTTGVYTYRLTWVTPNGLSSSVTPTPIVPFRIKVVPAPAPVPGTGSGTNTGSNNVTIQARNCTIPLGKSICPSTISVTSTKYVGTTGWRTFDLKNATRNLNSPGLFSPGNTVLNSNWYPIYTVSTSATWDAANYITKGDNDLILSEWGVVVARKSVSASCVTGWVWNGQVCAESGPTLPPSQTWGIINQSWAITARMTNCIIPVWKSTCPATILIFAQSGKTFSVNNITRQVNSPDLIKPIHYRILQGRWVYAYRGMNSPNFANNLTFGANTLTLTEKWLVTIVSTLKATASCATDKKWDGTKCISPVPSVFSVKTYQTALWEKTISGGVIIFNPIEDKTLTLKWVGPYGAIEVLEWADGRSILKTTSTDTTGKWQLNILPSILASQRTTTLVIWDGTNTSTQVRIQITNPAYQVPGTLWSTQLGDLTTVLVDLN